MLHINEVRKILREGNPFNCRVWKKDGRIMECQDVVCTSSNFTRSTANILFIQSRVVRKIRVMAIFEINDEEVII